MKNISKIFKKADSYQKLIELMFENSKEKKISMRNNFDQLKVDKNGKLTSFDEIKDNEFIYFTDNDQNFSINLRQSSKNNNSNCPSPCPSIILNKNINNNIQDNNVSYPNFIKDKNINIIFSPIFGKFELCELANEVKRMIYLMQNSNLTIKLGVQLHKLIWPNIEKGV